MNLQKMSNNLQKLQKAIFCTPKAGFLPIEGSFILKYDVIIQAARNKTCANYYEEVCQFVKLTLTYGNPA